MYHKTLDITILVIFLIWILPLGIFIKPDMEKKACNGRRAICLCRHLITKQLAKQGVPLLKNMSLSSDGGMSSMSPKYLVARKLPLPSLDYSFNIEKSDFNYKDSCIDNIEHVPRTPLT
ncbi:MAG: hypothetical protein KC713_06485 [Candidatus Omnitrophica bacterium]|nr:hypothetical protein [Candidatus Omnitrophota bacterium]